MKINALIIILITFIFQGCGQVSAPLVSYTNHSFDKIYDMRCEWPGTYIMKSGYVMPGGGGTVGFWLDSKKDFYGPILVSWENASGQRMREKLVLSQKQYPKIENLKIMFTQDSISTYVDTTKERTEEEKEIVKRGQRYRDVVQKAKRKKLLETNSEYAKAASRLKLLRDSAFKIDTELSELKKDPKYQKRLVTDELFRKKRNELKFAYENNLKEIGELQRRQSDIDETFRKKHRSLQKVLSLEDK